MKSDNVIESLSMAYMSALLVDIEEIEYNYSIKPPLTKMRRPHRHELNVIHFEQMWGSTALGFRGMGGSAMTSAYTTVIICKQIAYIYFDGIFAFSVKEDDKFREYLTKRRVPSIIEAADTLEIIKKR